MSLKPIRLFAIVNQIMSSSSFLQLPRELRNKIYDFLFPWETLTPIIDELQDHVFLPSRPFGSCSAPYAEEVLALLSVNRQISAEAKENFYRERTFSGEPSQLRDFLRGIGTRSHLVRIVEIKESMALVSPKYSITYAMPSLVDVLKTLPLLRLIRVLASGKTMKSAQLFMEAYGLDQLAENVGIVICNRDLHLPEIQPGIGGTAYTFYEMITVWDWAENKLQWRGTERKERFIERWMR